MDFTLADVRLPIESLRINALIEDTIELPTLFSTAPINCLSINETAIEKWVSLTRRIVAIKNENDPDDATLIRHVYDLIAIKQANKLNESFFNLSQPIIYYDAERFKNQYPEYFKNPTKEILHSLEILQKKAIWKERYQKFVNSMVYDKTNVPDYETAIQWLENISAKIIS